jgi:hypothetical protein
MNARRHTGRTIARSNVRIASVGVVSLLPIDSFVELLGLILIILAILIKG